MRDRGVTVDARDDRRLDEEAGVAEPALGARAHLVYPPVAAATAVTRRLTVPADLDPPQPEARKTRRGSDGRASAKFASGD